MLVGTVTTVDVFWLDFCWIIIPEQAQGRPITNQECIEKDMGSLRIGSLGISFHYGLHFERGKDEECREPISDPVEDELRGHIRDVIV